MTQAMHLVLLVEDDPAIRNVLLMLFELSNFRVVTADTCERAIRETQSHRPDICLVDLGLPDHDGLQFIRQTRLWSPVPIIVLTARTLEAQRLAAFEAGADDYVIKPFSNQELLARVRAILRRVTRGNRPDAMLLLGAVSVDMGRRISRHDDGRQLRLTPLEFRILECLARHIDSVVTHAQLIKEVWGPRHTDTRSLRVYIASLRRKLEITPSRPRFILTEPGLGFRLCSERPRSEEQPLAEAATAMAALEDLDPQLTNEAAC
jgi:two-component system, OmpR family, KDP operon response regulator KdpE